jgi:hypothetical protein
MYPLPCINARMDRVCLESTNDTKDIHQAVQRAQGCKAASQQPMANSHKTVRRLISHATHACVYSDRPAGALWAPQSLHCTPFVIQAHCRRLATEYIRKGTVSAWYSINGPNPIWTRVRSHACYFTVLSHIVVRSRRYTGSNLLPRPCCCDHQWEIPSTP